MALTVEIDGLYGDDLATSVLIGEGLNGVQVDVIESGIVQAANEMDGMLTERWELLAKKADFPSLYIDEELVVNTVTWKVEEVANHAGDLVEVHLVRYLS